MNPLLSAASRLYGGLLSFRNRLYDGGTLAVHHAGVPVLSVGNLTLGGTGKTPVTESLARLAAERSGRKVFVLSRGYRRPKSTPGPVVVSDGAALRCGWEEAGDEPMLLAENLLGATGVVVGASRRRAAELARREFGAELFVLDDGFQHRSLHRDVNLLLVDGADFLGNERLVPAGPMREPAAGLRRAGAVIFTRTPEDGRERALRWLAERAPGMPAFFARLKPEGPHWRNPPAGEIRRVTAFCALARPAQFRAALEGMGLEVVGWRAFPDHHRYGPDDLAALCGEAVRAGAGAMLTTQKDWVKIRALLGGSPPPVPTGWIRLRAELEDENSFWRWMMARCPGLSSAAAC